MGGFGERMQREREMRSITLEEIAESTKIGCRMLRALEEEDFEKLPGGIFNKGFVRAYAKFLGIDEEQAVTDFQAAFVEKQQRQSTNGSNGLYHGSHGEMLSSVEASAYADEHPQPDQAAGFMRAAVIIVILLGLGGLGWKFWGGKKPVAAPVVVVPVNRVPASTAPADTTTPAASKPQSTSAVTKESTPKQAIATKPPEVAKDLTGAAASGSENAGATSTAGIFRLQLYARERSWVKITGDDGKVLMQGDIAPSTSRSFRATKQMVLTLGNAPGVEISYNGQPLPQSPAEPKMRTLTFTPQGLQQ